MEALKLIFSNGRYFAPAFVFASLNILIGTWAIYIPKIKSKLGIDEGQLGVAIFCMALGTLMLIALAPKIMERFGVGKATAWGVFIAIFTFIIPFTTNEYSWLCIGMFVVGALFGFTDVAMNTLVTELEKEDDVHIMSANHGFFSLGGLISGGIGGFFLSETSVPIYHLLVVITIILIVNLFFVGYYYSIKTEADDNQNFRIKNFKPLFALALIAFFVMASEGAIVDWSALYLEKVSLANFSWIGLGFTAFSATMALGRFFGDSISKNFGSKTIILAGSIIGTFGFTSILLVHPIIAIVGFGLVGLGLSVIIPELFRLAGKTDGLPSSQSISFISGMGFFGFLVGPVVLGFLADISSLKLSFFALLTFICISFLLAIRLKK
ncbi:MAG: MFS transporter [Flavobacteriaceae bacterium]|nr:MFS transporter [Flavobacteriaceae bacterium]